MTVFRCALSNSGRSQFLSNTVPAGSSFSSSALIEAGCGLSLPCMSMAGVLSASGADLSRGTDFPGGGFEQAQTVICVWNGGNDPAAAHRQAEAALQQVHLLQDIDDLSKLKLVWVSDGLDLAAATVMGLGRVVQNEMSDLDL